MVPTSGSYGVIPTTSQTAPTRGRGEFEASDGLDIEAGGGVVVARELWGQPDDTPHRNGTDDRAPR